MDSLCIGNTRDVQRVKLVITQDTICPWCYISYKELTTAIGAAHTNGLPLKFDLEIRPYRLCSCLPTDAPIEKREMYMSKFGQDKFDRVLALLKRQGASHGVDITLNGPLRRTGSCYRLLRAAFYRQRELEVCECIQYKASVPGGELDLQGKVACQIFKAFFERGEDIADFEVLGRCAEAAGLMTQQEAVALLSTDKYAQEVEDLICEAQEAGIGATGIPYMLVNSRWAIVGGQTATTYYQIFEKIASTCNPQNAGQTTEVHMTTGPTRQSMAIRT